MPTSLSHPPTGKAGERELERSRVGGVFTRCLSGPRCAFSRCVGLSTKRNWKFLSGPAQAQQIGGKETGLLEKEVGWAESEIEITDSSRGMFRLSWFATGCDLPC